jgi:hypothetical protein
MSGIRDGYANFKFFEVIEPHYADPSVTLVTGATVDTLGYETLCFTIQHSILSLASVVDQIDVYIEEASQSAAGRDAWSICSAGDVYGLDMPRLMSVLTVDSWLALDKLTRASYQISIPVYASTASGHVLALGISGTSQASMITDSFVHMIGYKGQRRYVRLMISASTNVSYTALNAMAILGLPANWPVNMVK